MQTLHPVHSTNRIRHNRPSSRRGFTLVEMMVSVTVILLLMLMFAEVFQLAGSTITSQRGIAENDQRSRSIQTVLTSDLDKRSYRYVMPWGVSEDPGLPEVMGVLRKGYFYISENDPTNDVDDILQFTIDINNTLKNKDLSKLFGRATALAAVTSHPNQPEADDGWSEFNSTSESSAAEVAYFVRNGNLYRRVLLLRQPLLLDGTSAQPTFNDPDGSVRDMFNPNLPNPVPPGWLLPYGVRGTTNSTTFWNEFDHSAFLYSAVGTPWAHFHGVEDLANNLATFFALGKPNFRFGHRVDSGRPREFDANDFFFGRFTHEETSHPNFRYPQGLSLIDPDFYNPYTANALVINNRDGVIDAFRGGPRRGEDLLLSNVHSFDIKVWDQQLGEFVDIGSTAAADFQNPLNPYYGPRTGSSGNNVFDTWFPYDPTKPAEMDLNNDNQNDPPPYRHLVHTPIPLGGSVRLWEAGRNVTVGEPVFPNANLRKNGLRFYYRCIGVINGGITGSTEPAIWPSVAGGRISEPANAAINEPQIVWEAVENWKPLKAVQITVRFLDITSQQMRQLTIVHSLLD
ncbi:PilW family protein [Schlesneria sp. DSM 10557]|uniref:PilW family protein n=1 Tax=Schlesneria sp. DSM 10557 TaxID=3044399 RepID=UPI0035C87478